MVTSFTWCPGTKNAPEHISVFRDGYVSLSAVPPALVSRHLQTECSFALPSQTLNACNVLPYSIYDINVISLRIPAYPNADALLWSSGNLLQSVPFPVFHKQRSQSVTPYSCRFPQGESPSLHLFCRPLSCQRKAFPTPLYTCIT